MEYGKQIKEYRQQNSLTLEILAGILGISVSYLSLLENDKRPPSMRIARALKTLTGIDPF